MAYFPIAPLSDDRRQKQGCPPIALTNCLVRKTPEVSAKARRAPYFITTAPGRTLRATLDENIRGLFAAVGCRDGRLFIPNGGNLAEMTSSLSYTTVGVITGGDVVTLRADRSDLAVKANGLMYRWNGTALTQVTDGDAPNPASTLVIVARRWVAAFDDNDAWAWSLAGDFSNWPANNQAQDQDLSDPIVGQENIGGDLWSFNAESTEPWQATGGAETAAFAKVGGARIPFGLAAQAAIAPVGGGAMLLGHTRQVLGTVGYDLQPVPNPALEQDLKALTDAELADCTAWSYRDTAKQFWGLSAGLSKGYVFDAELGLWHERSRYGEDEYDIDFAATAFGRVFVASRSSPKLWSLDEDVYIDGYDADGNAIPLVRDMTVHIPSSGDVPVDRLVWDMTTRDVPLEGQGSSPVMQVRTSNDNGEVWSDWRDVALPTASNKFRVQDFAWGLASNEHGLLVHMRISDPIGFSMFGLWCNPSEQELNA